jgi:5-hydroxyisourate hydrolase
MKKSIFTLAFAFIALMSFAQNKEYQLSSHILDVSQGKPAPGVSIQLEKLNQKSNKWFVVDKKVTDNNGRVPDFLPADKSNVGIYKLTYFTKDYFSKTGTDSFYPFIDVVFEIKDANHYHVPITLSAFGYSTYRGN